MGLQSPLALSTGGQICFFLPPLQFVYARLEIGVDVVDRVAQFVCLSLRRPLRNRLTLNNHPHLTVRGLAVNNRLIDSARHSITNGHIGNITKHGKYTGSRRRKLSSSGGIILETER